jgi:hypothetical protein
MRRILIAALLFTFVACSDDPGSGDGPLSGLVPSQSMVVLRIASPEALDGDLRAMGIPPTSTFLPFLGMTSTEGVDFSKPWYLIWAEDAETREDPLILLPITDQGSFEEALESSIGGFTSSIQDGYALLGKGPLPELGNNPLVTGFTGDIEVHADLRAIRTAYAQEIQDARDSFQAEMEAGFEDAPADPSVPGFDPAAMGDIVQAEMDMMLDILEQSDDLGITLDLDQGDLTWTVAWALEPGTPWGNLVSDQRPGAPTGLGRVDLDQSMAFWMNHDLSENPELLDPFFEAMSGVMKGLNHETFSRLAGQEMEGVVSGGWGSEGMAMEAVYSLPDMEMSEFRDLVRDQMTVMGLEMPGLEMEFTQNVAQIGDMEVDLFVQEIQVPEDAEIPFPMQRTEAYYGWGEEEMFTIMQNGEAGEGAIDRLRELASREPGPIPARVQGFLDACPDELLMFGFVDLAGMMEGFAAMAPGGGGASLPEGLPPLVFYGTAEGSQVVYGGLLNLEAMMTAASAAMAGAMGGG